MEWWLPRDPGPAPIRFVFLCFSSLLAPLLLPPPPHAAAPLHFGSRDDALACFALLTTSMPTGGGGREMGVGLFDEWGKSRQELTL